MRIADPVTGAVREVMHEHVPTWFESGINAINWRWLAESDEILWWSQRNGWGNLYLYDAGNGTLKHAVTSGDGNVTEVLRIRSEEHTSELQSLMRISYAVFCLKKKITTQYSNNHINIYMRK